MEKNHQKQWKNFGGFMTHHQVLHLIQKNYGECSDWLLRCRKLWQML